MNAKQEKAGGEMRELPRTQKIRARFRGLLGVSYLGVLGVLAFIPPPVFDVLPIARPSLILSGAT
jgi:hypothetical protein